MFTDGGDFDLIASTDYEFENAATTKDIDYAVTVKEATDGGGR